MLIIMAESQTSVAATLSLIDTQYFIRMTLYTNTRSVIKLIKIYFNETLFIFYAEQRNNLGMFFCLNMVSKTS